MKILRACLKTRRRIYVMFLLCFSVHFEDKRRIRLHHLNCTRVSKTQRQKRAMVSCRGQTNEKFAIKFRFVSLISLWFSSGFQTTCSVLHPCENTATSAKLSVSHPLFTRKIGSCLFSNAAYKVFFDDYYFTISKLSLYIINIVFLPYYDSPSKFPSFRVNTPR